MFNIIKHPNDEYQRPCGSAKVEDTSCDPVVITPQEGSEPFSIVAGKYMYLNGYEILITAPNEGLLYLPLIRSRIPVEWNNLTVYKNDEEDYGCVTEGEARMQGSQTGAIARDLHRQVMALLTQGSGQWSGKLGDSFDAFEKIILEIEQAENPTPAQFSKFKNVGSIVNQALETWKESLQDKVGNAVADNMLAKIEQWKGSIQAAIVVETPTKATASSVKPEATTALNNYEKGGVIEKVLIAIKNGKNSPTVDVSEIIRDACSGGGTINGATRKTYLDGQAYFPTQIGCNTLINIVELSLSEDKTKIEGLNLRGDAADVEAIWNWLGIVRSGDLRLIDLKDESRIAGLDETLYLVRTPIPGRDVKVAWDTSLSGELVNTHTSGHQISKGEVANTSTVYTSVSQSPLNHKSTFDKGGRQVHLEVIPQEKTSRKEGIGSDNGAWTDFNDILDKIADAIKKVNSNDFIQLGTKNEPCNNGDNPQSNSKAQFCLEIKVAAEAEVSTEYEELSGERFYQHLKKEGDVFSLSLGFSRSFVPKKLSMDTEYVTFKPNLTIGFGGEGAYNSYKKYTQKLPVETQYTTTGQNTHEASLQVGAQLYGGISASGGLKGAIEAWGEISIGADATVLKVTYDFTNNKPAGSIGPLSAKVKGAYGYTIGPFKEKDEYDKEWEIIKELEIK